MGTRSNKPNMMRQMLSTMGVDNVDEVMADEKNILSFAKSLNKNLGIGKQAVDTLSAMQNRNPDREIAGMGVSIESLTEKHDTLSSFQSSLPAFLCAESTTDQTLRLFDGGTIKVNKGENLCMTPSMYKAHIVQHPTLIPSSYKFSEIYKPYKGEDLTGKTLFVWRSGGIGDLMFIRPILMAFKEKYKDIEIIFATRSKYHSMVEQWDDCIDQLTDVPFFVDETLNNSDYHISYEGLIERCELAEQIDVHDLFAQHSSIEINNYNCKMKCICKNQTFDILPKKYAVMQLGASSAIRTPFTGKLIAVADFITEHTDLIISGSKREQRDIDDFKSCCKNPDRIINFARHTGSVVDAVKLVTGASIVVAPDSSHVHMAAAQGVPCVGIYGPFPWKSRAAHYKNFIGVEPKESECCTFGGKGCFTHSFLPCHYNTACWHNLDSQEIINAVKELTKWH